MPDTAPTIADFRYNESAACGIDVYQQATTLADGNPCFIWFHGGNWASGDKNDLGGYGGGSGTGKGFLSYMLDAYLDPGGELRGAQDEPVNFVGVNYRMGNYSDGGVPASQTRRMFEPSFFPTYWEDAGRAIQTVKDNAAAWNINPNQIAVAGFSVGGTLAMWHGFMPSWSYMRNVQDPYVQKHAYESDSLVQAVVNYDGQISYNNDHWPWGTDASPLTGRRWELVPFGRVGRLTGEAGSVWTNLPQHIRDAASPLALINRNGFRYAGQGVYSLYDDVGEEASFDLEGNAIPPPGTGWTDQHSKGQRTVLSEALDAAGVEDHLETVIASGAISGDITTKAAGPADTHGAIVGAVYQWLRARWGFIV